MQEIENVTEQRQIPQLYQSLGHGGLDTGFEKTACALMIILGQRQNTKHKRDCLNLHISPKNC
jgi:hypothetical protein